MIDPLTGAAVVTGVAGLWGGSNQNAANAKEARKNREWMERMSNTAFQRQKADLEAAGLNPALALSKGGSGADTPGSSAPRMENVIEPAVNSAAAALQQGANVARTAAEIRHTQAATNAISADIAIRKGLAEAQIANMHEATLRGARENSEKWVANTFAQREADLRLTQASAKQASLEIPALENMSRAAQTWWGRNVSPFLNDAKAAATIGAAIAAPGVMLRGQAIRSRLPQVDKIDEDIFFEPGQVYKRKTITRK